MSPVSEASPAFADLPAEVALPKLLEEHGGRLYRLGLKLCGHPDDAEDLVQEIFLNAFRKWHQFKGESKPTTWLYTIAARACTRRRRLRSGEPRTMESLSTLLPGPEDTFPDLTQLEGPFDETLQHETQEAVAAAIAELPDHFRMPLVLKEIVDLPVADVAAVLGLKEATVKTRVHRARLALRKAFSEALPQRRLPPTETSMQMCLDLLAAKQEALDRGAPFAVPQEEICQRCQVLFASLDLTQDICEVLGRGEMPPALRRVLETKFRGGGAKSAAGEASKDRPA